LCRREQDGKREKGRAERIEFVSTPADHAREIAHAFIDSPAMLPEADPPAQVDESDPPSPDE